MKPGTSRLSASSDPSPAVALEGFAAVVDTPRRQRAVGRWRSVAGHRCASNQANPLTVTAHELAPRDASERSHSESRGERITEAIRESRKNEAPTFAWSAVANRPLGLCFVTTSDRRSCNGFSS